MRYKYAVYSNTGKPIGTKGQGKKINPDNWITGPDPIRHDKYYALLKHRAQAKFRGEDHSLTWEQWEALWPDDVWFQRGRQKHSLCLQQLEPGEGWHLHNVEIVTRLEHLQKKRKRELGNE